MWLWVPDTQDAPGPSHAYPRWSQRIGEGGSRFEPCSRVLVLPILGSFYPLHVTGGLEPTQGLTRLHGHKRVPIAYLGPQFPERGPGAAVRTPLCAWRLGRAGEPWQRRRLFPLAPGAPAVLGAGTLPFQAPPSPPSRTPSRFCHAAAATNGCPGTRHGCSASQVQI